jgi:20S proteasome subunit alpha 7
MLEKNSDKRIYSIDRHCGIALAGWKPDCRQIVNKARSECKSYSSFYGSKITSKILCDRMSSFIHTYTLYWHLRPFGASTLVACYDEKGPSLFEISPSGISWGYYASAVGKGSQGAKSKLESLDFKKITCKEAVKVITDM